MTAESFRDYMTRLVKQCEAQGDEGGALLGNRIIDMIPKKDTEGENE